MVGIGQYTGPNRRGHPRLARPRGVRRHFGPFIDEVDDRLRDLIQERERVRVRSILLTLRLCPSAIRSGCCKAASDARPRASVARADPYMCGMRTGRGKRQYQRTAFDAMLKDAVRRRFDVLMVWSIDRLGRSVLHVANALAELDVLLALPSTPISRRSTALRRWDEP